MHEWWPNLKRPGGGWAQTPDKNMGRAGSIYVSASITREKLCDLNLDDAAPIVFELAVVLHGYPQTGRRMFDFAAAGSGVAADAGLGYVSLVYGSGGVNEHVDMDLRSGSYQLPPCEQVRVTVTTLVNSGTGFVPVVDVSGMLAAGVHASADLPTYTYLAPSLLAASPQLIRIPDKARSVDCWIGNTSGALKYGVGAPVLSLQGAGAAFPQVIRDYTSGIFVPPYRADIACDYDPDVADSNTSGVNLVTSVNCEAVVQFTMEL